MIRLLSMICISQENFKEKLKWSNWVFIEFYKFFIKLDSEVTRFGHPCSKTIFLIKSISLDWLLNILVLYSTVPIKYVQTLLFINIEISILSGINITKQCIPQNSKYSILFTQSIKNNKKWSVRIFKINLIFFFN